MNARQKVKRLKREIEFYKKKVIQSKIIDRSGMCKHRAVCYIQPEFVHLLGKPVYLDCIAGSMAKEFTQVIRDNMRIEDRDMFEGSGKVAIFDIYYIKGGDT